MMSCGAGAGDFGFGTLLSSAAPPKFYVTPPHHISPQSQYRTFALRSFPSTSNYLFYSLLFLRTLYLISKHEHNCHSCLHERPLQKPISVWRHLRAIIVFAIPRNELRATKSRSPMLRIALMMIASATTPTVNNQSLLLQLALVL